MSKVFILKLFRLTCVFLFVHWIDTTSIYYTLEKYIKIWRNQRDTLESLVLKLQRKRNTL